MRAAVAMLLGAALGAAVGQFLGCGRARGHDAGHDSDWIGDGRLRSPVTGELCCGHGDCIALDPSAVEQTPDGWTIRTTGERIPWVEGQRSQDGRIWRCHRPDGSRRCFFYVPGTS